MKQDVHQKSAAEVGALLGVEFMINGAIGKLGDVSTIDAKMLEVARCSIKNKEC